MRPPDLIPMTADYISFWRLFKDRCKFGMWCSGIWMPGELFFYYNAWKIKLKKPIYDKFGKIKGFTNNEYIEYPDLRDIEWEYFYTYSESRGFSRFENNTEEELAVMTPREIMRKHWDREMGRPMYENPAKNIILIAGRGAGKSYWASCVIGYEFLIQRDKGIANTITVGAGDSKFSKTLLQKVKLGLNELPGSVVFGGISYPSPISKQYKGSFEVNEGILASYVKYIAGAKKEIGDGSSIGHITFKDNDFAANGRRSCLLVFEEIGLFPNFRAS